MTDKPLIGHEDKISNDVFFVCSLIEYIGRKTHNHRNYVAQALGTGNIKKLLDLADVYHSDNIDRVSDEFIKDCNINGGDFDNVASCKYAIPTHWDIGKVYKRLALGIAKHKGKAVKADNTQCAAQCIIDAFTSFSSGKIEDFNSSFYYDNPAYILECALNGELID